MGSFNLKCSLSLSTLQPRERCLVIPVVQTRNQLINRQIGNGTSSEPLETVTVPYGRMTNAFYQWSPLSLPLIGSFDDRFYVDLDEIDVNKRRLLHLVSKLMLQTECIGGDLTRGVKGFDAQLLIKTQYPELPAMVARLTSATTVEDEQAICSEVCEGALLQTWDKLVDAIYEDLVVMKGSRAFVQLAVISLEAKNALISGIQEIHPQFKATYEKRVCAKLLEEIRILNALTKDDNQRLRSFVTIAVESALIAEPELISLNPLRIVEANAESMVRFACQQDVTSMLALLPETIRDDLYFLACLDEANFPLSPSMYGGQDYSNEYGQLMAKIINAANIKVTTESWS